MFESSKSFDISQMKGAALNQVCVGLYQVILHFENNISVSCESQMSILDNRVLEVVFPPPSSSVGILKLLGQQIAAVELDQAENLLLTFPGGIVVEVERDNEGYESFHVWIGKEFLIV